MRNDTSKPSRWRRKVLGVSTAWWMGIAAVALGVAGYAIILNVTGTLTTAQGINVSYTNNNLLAFEDTSATNPNLDCTIAYTSPSSVQLGATGVLPGDVCRYRMEMTNTGQAAAKLNGFKLVSAGFAGKVTTAVRNSDNSATGCGNTLNATTGIGFFQVVVTFGPTVAPGDTFTFGTGDGFDWRIASLYNPAECT